MIDIELVKTITHIIQALSMMVCVAGLIATAYFVRVHRFSLKYFALTALWLTQVLVFYIVEAVYNTSGPNIVFTFWSSLLRLSGVIIITAQIIMMAASVVLTNMDMNRTALEDEQDGTSQ